MTTCQTHDTAFARQLYADDLIWMIPVEWKFTTHSRSSEVARRYTHVYVRGGPLGWRIQAVHMGQAPSR